VFVCSDCNVCLCQFSAASSSTRAFFPRMHPGQQLVSCAIRFLQVLLATSDEDSAFRDLARCEMDLATTYGGRPIPNPREDPAARESKLFLWGMSGLVLKPCLYQ
jgi:hypothetical protein